MVVKKSSIRTWSRLGQRGCVFGLMMPELAAKQDNLKLLTADLSLLSGMDRFIKEYPEQFLNVGIAEQNMIGIAAGMAMEGACVFATTYASFIAVRSLEHVRQHLAHLHCNVKLIGSSAGVTAAKSGVSHWATEDIAFMRALPGMVVLSPADGLEAMKAVEYAAGIDGPVYIRLSGGLNCPAVYDADYEFQAGKNIVCREGKDTVIFATGLMVREALDAADLLMEQGIDAKVVNVHTLKPFDRENAQSAFGQYRTIFTVEEHNVTGGLGGAMAETMSEYPNTPRLVRLGFGEMYLQAGSPRYVWQQAGLTAEQIADRVRMELGEENC